MSEGIYSNSNSGSTLHRFSQGLLVQYTHPQTRRHEKGLILAKGQADLSLIVCPFENKKHGAAKVDYRILAPALKIFENKNSYLRPDLSASVHVYEHKVQAIIYEDAIQSLPEEYAVACLHILAKAVATASNLADYITHQRTNMPSGLPREYVPTRKVSSYGSPTPDYAYINASGPTPSKPKSFLIMRAYQF